MFSRSISRTLAAPIALDRPPCPHGVPRPRCLLRGACLRGLRLHFLDARRLAGQVAQIVELGAAHTTPAHDIDVGEHGAVQREDALDADAVGDLADGERLADTDAAAGNAHSLERLDALLLPFLDAHVHANGITGAEHWKIAEPLFLGFDENMHTSLGAEGPVWGVTDTDLRT